MKKIFGLFIFLILLFGFLRPVYAQNKQNIPSEPTQNYYKGTVVKVIKEGITKDSDKKFFQILDIKITEGKEAGHEFQTEFDTNYKIGDKTSFKVNDTVVVLESTDYKGKTTYSLWEKYRLNSVYYIALAFFAMILIFAGFKGFGSLVGMGVSLLVLLKFIVPQILSGADPLLISIIGSLFILSTTIYLAHGVSKKTSVAVFSTLLTLVVTAFLSLVFVRILGLSGLGDENNYLLQMGNLSINPQGLLLGGIIIGALGVLEDTTTTQSAAIFELAKSNSKLTTPDLFKKGYSIGREHIVALVNTLVLAYAGAALSLFVIFILNPTHSPAWVILNSEMVIEEVIRTIAGSMGLILAVPITTLIASYLAVKKSS